MSFVLVKVSIVSAVAALLLLASCKKDGAGIDAVVNPIDTALTSIVGPDTTTPAAPNGLNTVIASSRSVLLQWTDHSQREAGFKIERRLVGDTSYTLLGTVAANVTTFLDTNVNLLNMHFYRVYAYNNYGNSYYSNLDSASIHVFNQQDQESIAPAMLGRIFEISKMVYQFQHGYAIIHPYPDTVTFLRKTDGSYGHTSGDTLSEAVKFIPDVWANPSLTNDSIWYQWDLFGGDTVGRGKYGYVVAAKRMSSDSVAPISGSANFNLNYRGRGWAGAWNDYSYSLNSRFALTDTAGNGSFNWNGIAVSTSIDLTPIRWQVTGTTTRNAAGTTVTDFSYNGNSFMRGTVDSAGYGSYQLKWDNFSRIYSYHHN